MIFEKPHSPFGSDVRVISAQLEQTSMLAGYSQDGAIFSYENTRLTLVLVGFNLENVSKVGQPLYSILKDIDTMLM